MKLMALRMSAVGVDRDLIVTAGVMQSLRRYMSQPMLSGICFPAASPTVIPGASDLVKIYDQPVSSRIHVYKAHCFPRSFQHQRNASLLCQAQHTAIYRVVPSLPTLRLQCLKMAVLQGECCMYRAEWRPMFGCHNWSARLWLKP